MSQNYYQILNVPPDADQATIKQAYRRLARQYHPDLNQSNPAAAQQFKEINEAYATLSDSVKRQAYDTYGRGQQRPGGYNWESWFDAGNQPRQPSAAAGEEPASVDVPTQPKGGGAFASFLHSVFGSDENPKPSAPRPRRTYTTQAGPPPSVPLREKEALPVEITLEEAFRGTSRTIQQGAERFDVLIPPGVDSGSRVRFTRPEQRDEIVLLINVRPHAHLSREGADIVVHHAIDLYTALLGGEIRVPTLEGELLLMVPPNTQNGRVFRLRNQGMPRLDQPDTRGDLYVETQVTLPVPLSEEERQHVLALQKLRWQADLFAEE
jgi:curved DNA-binding protein